MPLASVGQVQTAPVRHRLTAHGRRVEECTDPRSDRRPVGSEPDEVGVGTALDEFSVADAADKRPSVGEWDATVGAGGDHEGGLVDPSGDVWRGAKVVEESMAGSHVSE